VSAQEISNLIQRLNRLELTVWKWRSATLGLLLWCATLAHAQGIQPGRFSCDDQPFPAEVQALFDPETAPDTREGVDQRLNEMNKVLLQCRKYALQTQTTVAFQRAELVERMRDDMLKESLNRINQKRLGDWPRPK
jgi:hypothetical protein